MPRSDSGNTIVATSSPAGRSPRAIVRLSGSEAVRIASSVFESDLPLSELPAYSSAEGCLRLVLDDIRCPATVYVMRAPRSYTREDVVELHTVGAPPLLAALAEALLAAGARAAEPGEFTRRAFLNGRLDLTQAEAVQAIIHARSEAELRVSQAQLQGSFRDAVASIRSAIIELLARVEASIDFVDQDIARVEPSEVVASIARLVDRVGALLGAGPPAPPKEGVATTLCGLPNVGKSSLLNALAGHARAIVTDLPGTTRDTVEHSVEIDGITFRLVDTAGVRASGHAIETEAIARATAEAESADLVLMVIDVSRPLADPARSMWERLTARPGAGVITVLNKSDLPVHLAASDEGRFAGRGPIVATSVRTGEGLGDLRAAMVAAVCSTSVDRSAHPFWLGARHRAALTRTAGALETARQALVDDLGLEFAAADLRDALTALGEIVGPTATDDILDTIFSQFCIGK